MKDTAPRGRPGLQGSGQLRLAGIDGCRSGWIMALAAPTGPLLEVMRFETLAALIDKADLIAIDMPLGLRQGPPRRADAEARALLGPRRSSVFSVPHRDVLEFTDWAAANHWSKATGFGGISKQAWNIVPKMREANGVIGRHGCGEIIESHPEVVFGRLAPEQRFEAKRKKAGQLQRLALLQNAGLDPAPYLKAWPRHEVALDDILDACVLVLTARHKVLGTARFVPAEDEYDRHTGRPMRIWF